jgi:hypothetical protein
LPALATNKVVGTPPTLSQFPSSGMSGLAKA